MSMDDKLCVYCQVAEAKDDDGRTYGPDMPTEGKLSAYLAWGGERPPMIMRGHMYLAAIHYCPMGGRKLGD